MISEFYTELNSEQVSVVFGRIMSVIKIAQAAEKSAYDLEKVSGAEETALINIADQAWSYGFTLSRDLRDFQPETDIDYHYVDVARLLHGLLDADLADREDFADRAAEKRVDLGPAHALNCPVLADALNFLVWQDWLPKDHPDSLNVEMKLHGR